MCCRACASMSRRWWRPSSSSGRLQHGTGLFVGNVDHCRVNGIKAMTSTPEIVVEKNVAYTSGERPLLWDIYRTTPSNETTPMVLALHGGGQRGGHLVNIEREGHAFFPREHLCD